MFISNRKLTQGFAAFVLATGIVGIAFSSGSEEIKPVKGALNQRPLIQEKAKTVVPATKGTQGTEIVTRNKVTSRSPESQAKVDFKYKVQSGDTLYDLAIKNDISTDEIMLASNLSSDKLSIDQELTIPVSGKFKKLAALKRSSEKTAAAAKASVNRKQTASRSEVAARPAKATVSTTRVGEMISWAQVSKLFPRGATAQVIDVDTGLVFKVKRLQGTYHADSEPLTAEDTAILKRLYGGKWSWSRRAVVVVVNGKKIAGSINGMPHAEDSISSNNFAGHICIHFKDSTTHGSSYTKSGQRITDPQHQAMVRKAAGK